MDEAQVNALQAQVHAEILEWCEKNVIGVDSLATVLAFKEFAVDRVASRYKVPREWVTIIRPRLEDDSRVIAFDGFMIVPDWLMSPDGEVPPRG